MYYRLSPTKFKKQLRVYPEKFVNQIYDIFSNTQKVQKYLRNKTVVQHTEFSDHEIFAAMPLGDLWEDAGIASVYFYLRKGRHLVIPDSWSATITAFDQELSASVPGSAAHIPKSAHVTSHTHVPLHNSKGEQFPGSTRRI